MRSNLLSVVKALGEKKICGFPISSCKNLGGVGFYFSNNRTPFCLVSASTLKDKFP
jgi:hypothetical protein